MTVVDTHNNDLNKRKAGVEVPDLDTLIAENRLKSHALFANSEFRISEDAESQKVKLTTKIYDEYLHLKLPPSLEKAAKKAKEEQTGETQVMITDIIDSKPTKELSDGVVALRSALPSFQSDSSSLIRIKEPRKIPNPTWHAPWKLMRVIAGHTGWVRDLTVDVSNEWFATGAGDRIIKIWDMASGTLKLSLTGHIGTVRGVVSSDRHPYLFSAGEDKQIKCWDLETNKVIRHYHGHLSGIYN
jgi:pleiotropic regulator 1